MSHQLTPEEQFSEIKEFLAKTWKIIVAVIVIGLLAFYGWRYWQSYKVDKSIESSERYEQLIAKLDNTNPDSVGELVAFAKNDDTIYSVFASFNAAKFYVEVLKDYKGAQVLLTDSLKKTDAEPVKAIAYIRIARLQYQQEQYQESLTSLSKISEKSWMTIVNDIRGDNFVKMDRYSDAVDAYNLALTSSTTNELKTNIKMKLNEAEYLKAKQDEQAIKDKEKQESQGNKAATEESKN
ncbi:tetratricopeptide repeat protein [Gilliamella sp. B2776]|uniref:YfgM family protein n=1 Tax=unclassified Gilliamella TaxID=2685620 RepID=UPI00226989CB|nr:MULTISPECIES: tetratricopeptide repeat protein [unclassified Gilliamella]MCX8649772.1 tetratricopeptide repeat protein [Gilliamella sp. B2779]MCX8653717.1 tetratricopeptide repeat protein [Gilliamella sp. B2737]MCX8656092.1 tetratricopeptide repeat protein [Gilliamella sp. B2894]MCX8664600.1 tetratricopeptide repeat protein [Gilliamella sp. B2887]MCX8691545.1 tetratricopeptide repeat protein [Gilliamella sp. B2776]